MPRPRHPDKHLEAVLRSAELQGWRIVRIKKYFKMYCPCPDKHMKTVRLTPYQNYEKNLRGKLESSTCWKEVGP